MKILIIEDDKNKLNQVNTYLKTLYSNINVTKKYSYNSGLREVIDNKEYNLLLLDMSMPTFDITVTENGGRPKPFAGIEILKKLKRRKIDVPTIIITQFERFGDVENSISLEELKNDLVENYNNYIGTVYYNSSQDTWKYELKKYLIDEALLK